jgi:CHAT domain-containing protein
MRSWQIGALLGCLAASFGMALAAEPTDLQPAALTLGAPPRTVGDITSVLREYKPDPQKDAAAKAAADQQPAPGLADAALADFYRDRGIAAGQVGRITQQLDDLRQALASADKAGTDRSVILQQLMGAEYMSGNVANAIHDAEERAEIDDRRGAKGRLFGTYGALVKYNINRGDLAAAEQWVERSKALFAEMQSQGQGGGPRGGGRGAPRASAPPASSGNAPAGNRSLFLPGFRASVASAEAELADARGRYRDVEVILRTAVEQSTEFLGNLPNLPPGERPPEASFENGRNDLIMRLAQALQQQGKLVEAEFEARQALVNSLKTFGRYHGSTAMRLGQVTLAVLEQGRAAEAEQLARARVNIYETIDATRSWGLASARGTLGSALVAQARWTDALASYDAMMAGLAGDDTGTRRFGAGTLDWATALIKTGRLQPALAMVNRQVEHRRQVFGDQHYETAEARGYLGMALAAQGQREPALQAFRNALPILLATPAESAEDGPTARARRLHLVLDAYIRLLADIRGTPSEAKAQIDPAGEAFRLADAARGQAVQKAMNAASARVTLHDPALADLARREQDSGQALAGLEGTLVNALSAPSNQQEAHAIDVLRDQIAQLHRTRDGLRQEIARRFPDYAELVNPKPATIETARRALRPGEALVATYVSDDVTFVWAVSQQGPVAFAKLPLSAAQLAATVKQLRRALDPQAQTRGEIPAFDVALASKLYDGLLKPVEPGWKGASSLLVVPDQALAQLPLGVLVTASVAQPADSAGQPPFAGYKAVPFLARQVAITQLPSVAALTTLRALPAAGAGRKPFIGFGDPLFSTASASAAQIADAGALTTRGVKLRMRSAPKTETADSATLAMLPRLPDTAEEVRSIARALDADPDKDVFVGAAANEHEVETLNLADRRVIAFATHGLVPGDLDGLTEPALALSAPQIAHVEGDGLLTMDEVLALKLNADWVVLSACNTAAGDGAGAEAVSGLGRAFFYAGARALLVSNWPVETSSARRLTTDLFRRQAENPTLSRAEALRQAELGLIDSDGMVDPATKKIAFSYAHPIFWAPFSLVGDGGS